MSSATPVLQASDVFRAYEMGRTRIEILRGLSLTLNGGESTSVVGASGSGKTTMINVLGLLDQPDSGSVHVMGEDALAASARRRNELRNREIGFVFQFYHLVHELTALENVTLPARIGRPMGAWLRDRAGVTERALRLLERVGLSDRMKHRPQELSGGERQRVAIARALINEPAILFCDEPTGNLDPRTSRGVEDVLFDVAGTNRAILVVTHDERFARRCDRVLRLTEGRLDTEPAEASQPGT